MRLVALLVLTSSLAGCARLQPLLGEPVSARPQTGNATALRDAVNDLALRETATIRFADGRSTRAEALRMDVDSTSWLDVETGRAGVAATADVDRVSFPGRRLGAGEGIVGGFMVGVLSGAAAGYLAPGSSGAWLDTRQDNAAFGAIGFGVLGAAVGGLVSTGSGGAWCS